MSATSSSSSEVSIPVGELVEDIPLRDLRLVSFLKSLRQYNSRNISLFSEELFTRHLKATDLFSFDHHLHRVSLDRAHFNVWFVDGDEASKYNFSTRVSVV